MGIALLAAVVYLANPVQLWGRLQQANPWWLLGGFGISIASNVVSAWRWRAMARWLGAEMSLASGMRWYFQAIGLNVLLPGAVVGGDVYRAIALQKTGQAKAASNLSVILDRVSGLWMLCAIGGLGAVACASTLAPWVHMNTAVFIALLLAVIVLWLLLPWIVLQGLRSNWFKLPGAWLEPVRMAAGSPNFLLQLWVQAASSALVQLLSAGALACGAMALGLHLSLAVWAFVIAPVFLMAALPVSVGGWGTREAAAVAALAPFGVPAALAVGIGLLYGVFALGQGALGALALGLPGRAQG
ncbi:lysylphosphatidylglycerol synthase transmembrane domain-containing protein [Comamonas testosteroni]|uniref:lysylphosphatidylglycerol synthase transmembrane domain-containing protein n=1 Tax=Comamonas testosteroni TaxID=285 RepID=UPI0026EE6FC3|nr:lysylphosphatidylglycerol synthase transmembrane domain-containing protein [Comamonas testosteroni]